MWLKSPTAPTDPAFLICARFLVCRDQTDVDRLLVELADDGIRTLLSRASASSSFGYFAGTSTHHLRQIGMTAHSERSHSPSDHDIPNGELFALKT